MGATAVAVAIVVAVAVAVAVAEEAVAAPVEAATMREEVVERAQEQRAARWAGGYTSFAQWDTQQGEVHETGEGPSYAGQSRRR